jgi:hypothetical protein
MAFTLHACDGGNGEEPLTYAEYVASLGGVITNDLPQRSNMETLLEKHHIKLFA